MINVIWHRRIVVAFTLALTWAAPAHGDEGMWLFNDPPRETLKKKYDFDATDAWLTHLMRASVRFNDGGSGSFVSSDGLILTNEHIGADSLQKVSTPGHDLVQMGFYAKTQADEIKCLDLELNVLMSIDDVTVAVSGAVKPGMSDADAEAARRAVMNTLEQDSLKTTGLRSDVVTLYHGGRYHLYRYKKYTDVRLVFAPEQSMAFFGGDPDNFEYPRYDLDVCFLRAYEDGKPAKIEHWLKWNTAAPKADELIFVSGNPGHTSRLNTVAHLEFARDRDVPEWLAGTRRREVLLRTYAERSDENARQAQDELFGAENSRKNGIGRLGGLQDPAILDARRAEEAAMRKNIRLNGTDPWDQIKATLALRDKVYTDEQLLEHGRAFNTDLFYIARDLVRMAAEKAKPNAERLRDYRESNLESLEQDLFSEAPIYPEFEVVKLADALSLFMEKKGADDPLVKKVLAGKSPRERAAQLVRGTKLGDVAVRKAIAAGGVAAVEASDDPMIQLARLVDPAARDVKKIIEQQIDEPQRQAYAQIAEAKFKVEGASTYPDATFTLRLSFGVVRGYEEDGKTIPPWTTMAGIYERAAAHHNQRPFALTQKWIDAKAKLDLSTPFNFVSTADIIGGNSGSPVVNRAGDLVGVIFDGNLQSLVWDYAYTDVQGRAVAVHAASVIEALRKIYDAGPLADELQK